MDDVYCVVFLFEIESRYTDSCAMVLNMLGYSRGGGGAEVVSSDAEFVRYASGKCVMSGLFHCRVSVGHERIAFSPCECLGK